MYFKAKRNYKKSWLCPRCGFASGKRDMNKHFSSDPPCEPMFVDLSYEEIAKDYDGAYDKLIVCVEEDDEPEVDPLTTYFARLPRSMLKALTMDSISGIDKARLMHESARIIDREKFDSDDRDLVTIPLSLLRVMLQESLPYVCKLRLTPTDNWNWIIIPFLRGAEKSYITHLRLLATLDSVTRCLSDSQEKAKFMERVISLHFFRFGGLPGAPGAGPASSTPENTLSENMISFPDPNNDESNTSTHNMFNMNVPSIES